MNEHERDMSLNAPLYEELLRYRSRKDVSMHVPGHKDGQAFRALGINHLLLSQAMEIDVTEITGTDDLHHPEGVILQAQQQAAELFGAEETFFLVGGSTAGNLALILSVCTAPGDIILVQRNVHKSVIHGLMLAGAHAVFLAPQQSADSGLTTIPSHRAVREALRRYPGAKGLLVTHPNYYGMGADLRPLAELCHEHGVPLLVDEAHGAHYGLHPALPERALSSGADGVVQSTHKMLTALTMGAMLHVQGDLLDRSLLKQRLAMVQSSSPSYLIMASLDITRSLLESRGPDIFREGLAVSERLRKEIHKLRRFGIIEPPGASGEDYAYTTQDHFKIVIYDKLKVYSGYELQQRLETAGCIPEMSDDRHVVLALSMGTTQDDADRVLEALRQLMISSEAVSVKYEDTAYPAASGNGQMPTFDNPEQDSEGLTFKDLFSTWNILSDSAELISTPVPFSLRPLNPSIIEAVRAEDSMDRLSAEMIIPYPPGIPLIYPGERITAVVANRIAKLRDSKAKCQGATDPSLQTIRVIKADEESRAYS